ncbi:hypothetical protein [Nocardia sp. NPDC004260]
MTERHMSSSPTPDVHILRRDRIALAKHFLPATVSIDDVMSTIFGITAHAQ